MERQTQRGRMTTLPRFNSNQLLAGLSSAERQLLEPDLEWVELATGTALHSSGKALRHVYFPTNATVSLVWACNHFCTNKMGSKNLENR